MSASALSDLKAAAERDPQMAIKLAHCYLHGDGVDKDLDVAEFWAKKAVALPEGKYELWLIYLHTGRSPSGKHYNTALLQSPPK